MKSYVMNSWEVMGGYYLEIYCIVMNSWEVEMIRWGKAWESLKAFIYPISVTTMERDEGSSLGSVGAVLQFQNTEAVEHSSLTVARSMVCHQLQTHDCNSDAHP